jgi:hypothetical protein
MRRIFIIGFFLFAVSSVFADDARDELARTLSASGVAADLESSPDGVAIRLLPDGGFQIFSVGTGVYDFDDPDDIEDARKEAELKAKANLSKFMDESLSTEEKMDEATKKVKRLSSENGETSSSIDKVSVKNTLSSIKSSSASLLRGAVVLASEKVPGEKSSGTYRVKMGISSKTIAASDILSDNLQSGGAAPVRTGGQPASAGTAASPTVRSAESGVPEGWIVCIGNGADRQAAVLAALLEGIQQVYGLSLEQDAKFQNRIKRFKNNMSSSKYSTKEMEDNTLTVTGGFVQEYRVVDVKKQDDSLEAKIYARIANPRSGGAVALMLCKPRMSQDKLTKQYDVGPKKRMSGHDLVDSVGKIFSRAFSGTNRFMILDELDLEDFIRQQDLAKDLVDAGLAPNQELIKAGQMLTADYILTSRIEDVSYSRTLAQDKETKKFGPVYKMSIVLSYRLVNAVTGENRLSEDDLRIKLDNDEIAALLEEDEDTDLLQALLSKVSRTIGGQVQ